MQTYTFENIRRGGGRMLDRDTCFFQTTGTRRLSAVPHTHRFYELVYQLVGEALHCVNGGTEPMKTGDFRVLVPGESHFFLSQSEDASLLALSVPGSEFLPLCGICEINAGGGLRGTVEPDGRGTVDLLSARVSSLGQVPDARLLLAFFLVLARPVGAPPPAPDRFREMLAAMEAGENLGEGVSAMLRLSGYSHTQLGRLFRAYRGTTPCAYLRELRLIEAHRLIASGILAPEEAAERVGYYSFSHFSGAFKLRFGQTPAAVRRLGRAGTVRTV